MKLFKNLTSCLAIVRLALLSQEAPAQGLTGKTVRIVVPFAAGGPADVLARVIAEQVGRAQGATMVVENRPGASSAIGTEAVARARADGNTVLVTGPPAVIYAILHPSVAYDPLTSFEPICLLEDFETSGWIGVVAPAGTPKEVIAHLSTLFVSALKAPEVTSKLLPQGLYPVGSCGADFGSYIRKQYEEYGRVIREANIKAE